MGNDVQLAVLFNYVWSCFTYESGKLIKISSHGKQASKYFSLTPYFSHVYVTLSTASTAYDT